MGYMRHHGMLVTSGNKESAEKAHQQALSIFTGDFEGLVSPVQISVINGYFSFAIFPDDSKEGWSQSEMGDNYREAFKSWMKTQKAWYDWAEVQYGDEEGHTCIVDDGEAEVRRKGEI